MANMFRDILAQIRRIPRGKVATYGDVAYAAGYPGASRQVAWALHGCGRSVPWQRVIGAGGRILCTGELGLEQRFLLQAEGVEFSGLRVRLDQFRFHFFAPDPPRRTQKRRLPGTPARSRLRRSPNSSKARAAGRTSQRRKSGPRRKFPRHK
ncbi:MAG: MGMT family protein [Candidatus Korobacteraceae bacterium]|jgi:methylated-DNA-protein-cysteine methyltransferase-like protein